jgi:ribosomal protein L11 methyltransferase
MPSSLSRQTAEPLWRLAVELPDEPSADQVAALMLEVTATVSTFQPAPGSPWLVTGFCQGKPDTGALAGGLAVLALLKGIAEPHLVVEILPDVDWLRLNQESFPARRVGRYFIYGSHFEGRVPAGAIGLRIDAATAFGTGEHATTAGCLLALDRLARHRRPARILDMGTGTGILAIAAAKTWGGRVVACDIDYHSVAVARENAAINAVAGQTRFAAGDGYATELVRRRGAYDLIVANILARPLAAMAGDLARQLRPGGTAILSGLLAAQERYVAAAHKARGLVFVERIRRDGWHTLVFRKPD